MTSSPTDQLLIWGLALLGLLVAGFILLPEQATRARAWLLCLGTAGLLVWWGAWVWLMTPPHVHP